MAFNIGYCQGRGVTRILRRTEWAFGIRCVVTARMAHFARVFLNTVSLFKHKENSDIADESAKDVER